MTGEQLFTHQEYPSEPVKFPMEFTFKTNALSVKRQRIQFLRVKSPFYYFLVLGLVLLRPLPRLRPDSPASDAQPEG